MDSTLSYGTKRKGPPSMEKGISDVISIVYLIVRVKYGKSRSFVNFSLQKLSFQSYNCQVLSFEKSILIEEDGSDNSVD